VPVPDKAAQAKALKLVKEVFAEEYTKKSAEDRLALAGQLLGQARDSGNDAATQYVMLAEARDIAAAGGDIGSAFAAADELAAAFAGVDATAMKLETLAAASKKVSDPAKAAALVDGHITVSADLLAAAELDRAVKVVAQAEPLARKAKDPEVTARLNQRKKELKELVSQFGAAVGAAKAKLGKSPADPAANATMGRFYCLAAGDWARGLAMLAKGNDQELRKLAAADVAAEGGAGDTLAGIGDAWWEFGEKQSGVAKSRARGRAGHWYEQALEELTGLQRTRVEKRLASVEPQPGGGTAPAGRTDPAVRLLENLVRNLPANARPRKGEPWDEGQVSRWLTGQARAKPFEAVLRVESVNVSRSNRRDMLNANFEPVGPVTKDSVDYELHVHLFVEGAVEPEIVKQLKRGTHVRVRGLVRSISASPAGGDGLEVRRVYFFIDLARPNLTIVKAPPKTGLAGGAKGGAAAGPDSAKRLLEQLARKMPDALRPGLQGEWRVDRANEWLAKQARDVAIDVTAPVQSANIPNPGAREWAFVYLDHVGPERVDGVDYYLSILLRGKEADEIDRMRGLVPGASIRVRGAVEGAYAGSWQAGAGDMISAVTICVQLEDDFTSAPAANAPRDGR
jgi:hypothetical protein